MFDDSIIAYVDEEITAEINYTDLNYTDFNLTYAINEIYEDETPKYLAVLLTVFGVSVFNLTGIFLFFFWKSHIRVSKGVFYYYYCIYSVTQVKNN